MNVSSVAAQALYQAQANVARAVNRSTNPANPIDAVSISTEAVALSEAHNQFSISIKTLLTADEIAKTAISLKA